MAKQSFLQGAFILVLSNILVKALGFCYQIIVVRLIGTEGIGLFNMVYPFYVTAIVLTTCGLPMAISRFVAADLAFGRKVAAEKTLGMAMFIMVIISSSAAFLLIIFSPYLINRIYADPRVIPAYLLLIPTILLIAVSSGIRGYFQGTQNMIPTAFTQLTEQGIRFIGGLTIVYFLCPYGLTWSAVGLAMGIFLSELGGMVYLLFAYRQTPRSQKLLLTPSWQMTGKLFGFGIPIMFNRVIVTLITAAEASLIPRQLMNAGCTLSEAASFYGELTGVAFTLLSIPSTLSYSLSTTLVPAVSEAQSMKHDKMLSQRTADAVGITLLAGVPAAIILFFWGPELARILFKVSKVGYLLKILSLGCVFLYLSQTTSGIIQGIGCVKTNFITTLVSGLLRLSGIYFLAGNPLYGTSGIAASYTISFFCLAFLNTLVIRCKTRFKLEKGFLLRLCLGGLTMIMIISFITPYVSGDFSLVLASIILSLLVFFAVLLITGDKYSVLLFQQLTRTIKKGAS